MILVVLGTHVQPFPRAVRLAARLVEPGEELVVQHGHTPAHDRSATHWLRWCDTGRLDQLIGEARIVVTHGGSGSMYQALRGGARPIVIPRLARYGEHVDDHQQQLPARLEAQGRIVVWADGEPAAAVLGRWRALDPTPPPVPDLSRAVWQALRTLRRPVVPSPAGGGGIAASPEWESNPRPIHYE